MEEPRWWKLLIVKLDFCHTLPTYSLHQNIFSMPHHDVLRIRLEYITQIMVSHFPKKHIRIENIYMTTTKPNSKNNQIHLFLILMENIWKFTLKLHRSWWCVYGLTFWLHDKIIWMMKHVLYLKDEFIWIDCERVSLHFFYS